MGTFLDFRIRLTSSFSLGVKLVLVRFFPAIFIDKVYLSRYVFLSDKSSCTTISDSEGIKNTILIGHIIEKLIPNKFKLKALMR